MVTFLFLNVSYIFLYCNYSFFDHAFNFAFKLANEASYSPVGWIGLQAFMKRLLIAKLRVIQELKEADTKDFCKSNPIEKPIFICGLPRTGTTFLQRLLSLDPSNTSPQTWELVHPVPRIKSDLQKDKKKRIKYCQKSLNDFLEVTPHFNEVHEMGAEIAEECTVMMALDAPAVMMNFHTILARQDEVYDWEWHKAYKNYYKGLQIIKKYRLERKEETNQSNKRWVLKAPPHIGQLDQLVQAFPDARIIWNHREPKECVPSFASLIRAGQDFAEGSGTIELDALGKQVMKYADKMYTSGDKFFEDVKAGNYPSSCRCSHVMYKNLIKNPVGTVESLYESFGYEFTADYKKAIEDYLEEDRRKRDSLKGKKAVLHGYTAEEYGLTDQEIDETFAWYRSKYFSAK